mgnify:CR=1 FL=1
MKYIRFVFILLFLNYVQLDAQDSLKTFTVMFYNVENLFDTVDDPATEDEEFTPGSEKNWNTEKYDKKLADIDSVIRDLPGEELPAIIGFAEVENIQVLNELAGQETLKRNVYKAILVDGNDPRGIDCGILYRPDLFIYEKHEMIPVEDLSGGDYPLRGILHISGKGPDGKPLDVYVNHWKSRRGGVKETENLRLYSAITLRKELERLFSVDENARVIIMGDFNDDPTNRSIYNVLQAGNKRRNIQFNDLYNLYFDQHNLNEPGSLAYQGVWQNYDQIILSYSLLNQEKGLSAGFDDGHIMMEDWMLYYDKRNDMNVPNRTYGGNNYYGGISDHFPVYISLHY